LDIDFHHGNGTQAIFYDRSDVFFVSLHGDPKNAFPHFLGHADEKGSGEGVGYNCNYPMPPGTTYDVWTKSLDDSISKIQNFSPNALIVSLGVDTYENDPISFFKLKSDDFFDVGRKIASINLPTLFVMEGGYAIKEIGVNTVNTLKGFENE
jgi:acetoin utilization deacetylase AcuC-like enzyme